MDKQKVLETIQLRLNAAREALAMDYSESQRIHSMAQIAAYEELIERFRNETE